MEIYVTYVYEGVTVQTHFLIFLTGGRGNVTGDSWEIILENLP